MENKSKLQEEAMEKASGGDGYIKTFICPRCGKTITYSTEKSTVIT